MGLESATFLSGLVTSNPVHATDDVGQGDDHLRLLKSVLQSTFPNADKAFYFPDSAAKVANYTVVAADMGKFLTMDASGAARTFTLPTLVAGDDGWSVLLAKIDTSANQVTVAPASGTIDGQTQLQLWNFGQVVRVYWDGSAWRSVQDRPQAGMRVRTVTATATLDFHDFGSLVVCEPAAGSITLNLPTAVGIRGHWVLVKLNHASFTVTLDPNGTETVDGAATLLIDTDEEAVLVVSDGANWRVAGRFGGALSDISLAGNNTWTGTNTYSAAVTFNDQTIYGNQMLGTSPTFAWDMGVQPNATLPLTANSSLSNPTGETAGQNGFLLVTQDATGERTLSFGSEYQGPFNNTVERPDPTASAATLYLYHVRAANQIILKKLWSTGAAGTNPWGAISSWREYNLGAYALSTQDTQGHGLARYPSAVQAWIENTTTNLSYEVGDRVDASYLTDETNANKALSLSMSTTNVYVSTGSVAPHLVPRGGGAASAITAASWAIVIRVYE